MDPIIIVPVALAVAWAATRKKKKTTTKKPELPSVTDEPVDPGLIDDPFNPFDGPGGDEPWRPGGPDLPRPPGQVGPKTFPGPSGGPKAPEEEDPAPIEIYPGTTAEEIEAFEHSGYGLFISSDCETVYQGERWYTDVFLPKARALVLGFPDAFHFPTAVIFDLLAYPTGDTETPTQACVAAWGEFVYGDRTPLGTFSGWISERSDPHDEYGDYNAWFNEEYPALSGFLWDLQSMLWDEPDLAAVFNRDWPADEPEGDLDFDPTEG